MLKKCEIPSFRLPEVALTKTELNDDGILAISNVLTKKRLTRRSFIKNTGNLLISLGLSHTLSACGGGSGGGENSETTTKNISYMTETGKFSHSGGVNLIALSPTETEVASVGSDYMIKIWNINDFSLIQLLETPEIHSSEDDGESETISAIAYHPNGIYLASVNTIGKMYVWDTIGGTLIKNLNDNFENDSLYSPRSIAFSSDGSNILISSNNGINIWNWDAETLIDTKAITYATLSITGSLAATCDLTFNNGKIYVWDVNNSTILNEIIINKYNKVILEFSNDEQYIAVTSYLISTTLNKHYPINYYKINSGELLKTFDYEGKCHKLVFNKEGSKIAAECDGEIWILNLISEETAQNINTVYGQFYKCMCFYNANDYILLGSIKFLELRSLTNGSILGIFEDFDSTSSSTALIPNDDPFRLCSCNNVCSCDTVCTCNTEVNCTCVQVGGYSCRCDYVCMDTWCGYYCPVFGL
jgi:WD40 repeat protein